MPVRGKTRFARWQSVQNRCPGSTVAPHLKQYRLTFYPPPASTSSAARAARKFLPACQA